MIGQFVHWLIGAISALGYPGIILLMAIESSVLPLPSELIMPPAGYLAARGEMNLGLAILAGVVGSVLGALINYFLAVTVGEPVLRIRSAAGDPPSAGTWRPIMSSPPITMVSRLLKSCATPPVS